MNVCSVNQMRNLDKRAMEEYGISQEILMENAGQAAYFVILQAIGVSDGRFVIFCGGGNNGGDGLVVARKLHSNGARVTVYFLGNSEKLKGAARQNYEMARALGIPLMAFEDASKAAESLRNADAVVDALFGTGLDRDVGGRYKDAIELINASAKPVISMDIPSGINGETGKVMGTAVKADYTITFGLPKFGNLLYPGFEHGGKLHVTHISFPPVLYNNPEIHAKASMPVPLPARGHDTHKGTFGKMLFIAGSSNYLGAPYFSALSSLKAGGGLSFLATPGRISEFIGNKGSELIFVPQRSTETGSIALENKQNLFDFSANTDFVVIGPGMSLNEETQTLVRTLVAEIRKPLLLDGDGITALAGYNEVIRSRKAPTVLTPHAGEMARIAGMSTQEVLDNKMEVLRDAARDLNAVIVLKGANSLVGTPAGKVYFNFSGNAGMSTAGSGDVLTGTIAAMYGLGLSFSDAVLTGVFIHGFAGDLAARDKGEDGMLAGDIMDKLPEALKKYREAYQEITADYYQRIYLV